MNAEKVKLIVKNMDLLLQSLKEEIRSLETPQYDYEEIKSHLTDYDEVFYEDDDD